MRLVAREKENGTDRDVTKPVYETQSVSYQTGLGEVYDSEGKKLTDEDIWKRAKVGAVVLVSANGSKVDSAYLEAIAKETLVFVLPRYVGAPAAGLRGYTRRP